MRNLLKNCRLEVNETEVYRMMGYPGTAGVSEPVREVCREQIHRVDELAEPWGGCCEVRVEGRDGDWIRLEAGRVLRSRRVASMLRRTASVKICLVTLGAAIAAEIRRMVAENCMIEALALDAAATVATHALLNHLRERICTEAAERNCSTTIPYGPGYTGWRIRDMPVLFSSLAAGPLPVRLNEQLMMIPEKSLLAVVGIVPGGRRTLREVVPCRICDLEHCSVRREPYRRGKRG